VSGLDDDVAALLGGSVAVGDSQQAFPLLTVDADGYPHAGLVSRRELRVRAADRALLLALRGRGARANLARSPTAGLIAIDGDTAHEIKLRVLDTREAGEVTGYVLEAVEHKRDTLGIALEPITYRVSAELAAREGWDAVDRVLDALAVGESSSPHPDVKNLSR
jgi:hypothetical protein